MKTLITKSIPRNEQYQRVAGDLVDSFPTISQPTMPKHLLKLRNAGLVSARVQAQQRIYNLEPKASDELRAWIAKIQIFWPECLDALERHLSTKEEQRSERP